MSTDMRELSRTKWATTSQEYEAINCGSLMRIADATELMAKNYVNLANDRDMYKRYFLEQQASASALRSIITKLRKAAKKEAA